MEDLIEFLQKMISLIGFGLNCSWDIVDKYKKNYWVNKEISKSCIFKCWNFANGSSELHNSQYFLKGLNKTFQMHLNILLKLIFAVFSSKYIKWVIFDILMTITLGVNITRRMTPIFLIFSLSSILWYISFLHFKNLKFQSHGVPNFQ